ncbi:MAG: hypothetical protein U1F11_04125 [Steroidobacteraceae bacterium]
MRGIQHAQRLIGAARAGVPQAPGTQQVFEDLAIGVVVVDDQRAQPAEALDAGSRLRGGIAAGA